VEPRRDGTKCTVAGVARWFAGVRCCAPVLLCEGSLVLEPVRIGGQS